MNFIKYLYYFCVGRMLPRVKSITRTLIFLGIWIYYMVVISVVTDMGAFVATAIATAPLCLVTETELAKRERPSVYPLVPLPPRKKAVWEMFGMLISSVIMAVLVFALMAVNFALMYLLELWINGAAGSFSYVVHIPDLWELAPSCALLLYSFGFASLAVTFRKDWLKAVICGTFASVIFIAREAALVILAKDSAGVFIDGLTHSLANTPYGYLFHVATAAVGLILIAIAFIRKLKLTERE